MIIVKGHGTVRRQALKCWPRWESSTRGNDRGRDAAGRRGPATIQKRRQEVAMQGGKLVVKDGPFTEAKELIGGFLDHQGRLVPRGSARLGEENPDVERRRGSGSPPRLRGRDFAWCPMTRSRPKPLDREKSIARQRPVAGATLERLKCYGRPDCRSGNGAFGAVTAPKLLASSVAASGGPEGAEAAEPKPSLWRA